MGPPPVHPVIAIGVVLSTAVTGGVHDPDALAGIINENLIPRRHGASASLASAAVRSRETDRRSGCSRIPPDAPPGIPPTGS